MSKIKRIIGCTNDLEKIGDSKCSIREITNEDAKSF